MGRWYIKYYDCRSKEERVAHCASSCVVKGQAYFPSELYFAGMVVSEAEADPMNGDTALTLMIGGKITVKNGRFPIMTGDTVMWYFEEEAEARPHAGPDAERDVEHLDKHASYVTANPLVKNGD